MKLTVGVPAFHAQKHICDCLSSIQIQSIRDEVEVIIASDYPNEDYSYLEKKFPNLHITILSCEKNTGPGLARQRCLDACTTDWITFIDADDVFYTPFALEMMFQSIQPNIIEVQGIFSQEVSPNPHNMRSVRVENPNHPWVFGRLYNAKFLKANDISFSKLRAMEDGEFNWKIRMSIEGTPLKIQYINEIVYLWRLGSEHSITRTGAEEDNIPQYNFDLCQIGATEASIRAAKFCRERNPFNGGIDRFIVEMMIDKYFTYIECKVKKPVFEEQNFYNAKRFYHECYKEIEPKISDKILSDMYTFIRGQHAQELLGIIPDIAFSEFMQKVKSDEYGGEDELKEIRSKLPQKYIDNDIKTGVISF